MHSCSPNQSRFGAVSGQKILSKESSGHPNRNCPLSTGLGSSATFSIGKSSRQQVHS